MKICLLMSTRLLASYQLKIDRYVSKCAFYLAKANYKRVHQERNQDFAKGGGLKMKIFVTSF